MALRLLLLEAGFLAGILAGFAALAWWLAGGASSGVELVAAVALMLACLLGNWALVRSGWKRLGGDFGGGPPAP